MCFLHTPQRNSQNTAGCPTLQLSSDTVYPETESDSTGKGLGPTGSPSSQMSPVLPANWLKLEVPTAPSRGSINVIEGLTELGKISLPTIYSDD